MSELARLWLPILLSGSAVFCVNFLIAYLATLALEPGATFSKVFQVTGTSEIWRIHWGMCQIPSGSERITEPS